MTFSFEMTAQDIFDVLDGAFSNFMVADMDTRRCETYMCPEEEAMYYARHDGDRTGRIVAHVCGDARKLRDALDALSAHVNIPDNTGKAVDRVEGRDVRESDIMVYLCCKYQHDESRRNVCDMFANACYYAMQDVLGKEA